MLRFIFRRILWSIPTVIIVTFLVFVAVRVGTDPVANYRRLNPRATASQIASYKEANGLEGSVPEQYVRWSQKFITGDWPASIKGKRDVADDIKRAAANSLVLGGFASVLGIAFGVGIGVLSALRQYSKFDSAATIGAFVGISVPPFLSGVLLQLLCAYYITKWFNLSGPFLPVSGVYPPAHEGFDLLLRLRYLILPATVVAIQIIAVYSRYMRASLLEVMSSDYLRTARAKGISERRVVVRHAMRNALIPIVTVVAIDIGAIMGGLIITERIFSYGGMGDFFLTAFDNGDFPQIMPWMVIVVVSIITFNLLADIAYAWLDPRIRLD